MGKGFAFIDVGDFTDQDLGRHRDIKASHLGNLICRLTDNGSIECAVFQDCILHGFQFFTLQQITTMTGKTFTHRIIYSINNDNRLF